MTVLLLKIFLVMVAILLINVPFGYWRSNSRKFSWNWIMAIHIPVPIAIGLRLVFLGWMWVLLPAFVLVYAVGQFVGGRVRRQLAKQEIPLSSCLMLDLVRMRRMKQQPHS